MLNLKTATYDGSGVNYLWFRVPHQMKQSKKIIVQVVNGFVDNGRGGNPAGLVSGADDLTGKEKQAIAARTGLSETAFVSYSSIADFKFDFYTPTKQIAHCGHATIAAFSYFKQTGFLKKNLSSKETIDGTRKILLEEDNAFMEQAKPLYVSAEDNRNKILLSLGLQSQHLIDESEPYIVNTGNSFLIAGVKDKEILRNLRYDPGLIASVSEKYNLIGYYVFAREAVVPEEMRLHGCLVHTMASPKNQPRAWQQDHLLVIYMINLGRGKNIS